MAHKHKNKRHTDRAIDSIRKRKKIKCNTRCTIDTVPHAPSTTA